jgi:hypothetical protein
LSLLTGLGQLPLGGYPILNVASLGTTPLNPDRVGTLTNELAFLRLNCGHLDLTCEIADRTRWLRYRKTKL